MQEIYNPVVKEKTIITEISNGLTVIILPKKQFNRNYAIFATRYGSIDKTFVDKKKQ